MSKMNEKILRKICDDACHRSWLSYELEQLPTQGKLKTYNVILNIDEDMFSADEPDPVDKVVFRWAFSDAGLVVSQAESGLLLTVELKYCPFCVWDLAMMMGDIAARLSGKEVYSGAVPCNELPYY